MSDDGCRDVSLGAVRACLVLEYPSGLDLSHAALVSCSLF